MGMEYKKIHAFLNDCILYRHEFEEMSKCPRCGVMWYKVKDDETFLIRAMLFCTINDFPTYGNLSGYSVKGHHACPIYEEDTSYIQLKHGRKTIYTRHRRFLKPHHPYR